MTSDPSTSEPITNPDADDDPLTETPGNNDPQSTPPDNPSGSASTTRHEGFNEGQGDDVASGGS